MDPRTFSPRRQRIRTLGILSLFLFCILGFLSTTIAYAKTPALELNPNAAEQSLNGHVEFIFDPSAKQPFEEIWKSDQWSNVGDKPFSKGMDSEGVWLRFRLFNPSTQSISRIFQVNNVIKSGSSSSSAKEPAD